MLVRKTFIIKTRMSNLLFLLPLIFLTCLIKKCEFLEESKDSSLIPVSAECEIPGQIDDGYCVPIYNCLALIRSNLTDSEKRARKCGSHNENVKQPKVCCEKSLVKLETTSTYSPSFVFPESETQNETQFPECGIQEVELRLVGGYTTVKKEFPWLARLLRKDVLGDLLFSCTGALISSKVVLTTAHCLVSESLVQVGDLHAVTLGEHETTCSDVTECLRTKKTILISKYLAHPSYKKDAVNHDNDIGLIFLKTRVQFTTHIVPICLLKENVDLPEYYIGGWGKTESGKTSNVKLKITVPPFPWKECVEKYKTINVHLTPRQVCAGGVEGVDSCQGDSGGPLMIQKNVRWYVAGVVSFGVSCGRKGWPGIYIHVPSYINWITENIDEKV